MESSKFLAVRCYLNLSQSQFAEFLGVSAGTVAKIESGTLQVSGRMRGKLAAKFDFDDAFLAYYINFNKTSQ